jgi:hypothetical protein
MRRTLGRTTATILLTGMVAMNTLADEGMWLLNDPPRDYLRIKYQFDLTDAWLRRAMHASVRFNNGGSGGFVSPSGLVVTNHHIGADALQKLSTPQRDLLRDGFLAKSRSEELPCHDLELNVLQSIEDVTAQVEAAVHKDLQPGEAAAARRAIMSKIEKQSLDATGLRSDVVTLYQGGLYHLYRYKKYTDVRLVFAPEASVASFGGDVDNFEYPRHGLDVCFFRVYENNQPVQVQHFFPWSKVGPQEGDLVFVTGHPGTTNRLETVGKFQHRRDRGHPYALARLRALEAALLQFSERGPDERRMAATDLHTVANARKAMAGQYEGLLDNSILARKSDEENKLIQHNDAKDGPWREVNQAIDAFKELERDYYLFERGDGFQCQLFSIARHLVRLATELQKPSGERLREYRDSNLDSLKLQLFSSAPIHSELEKVKLTSGLTFLAEQLGGEHKQVAEFLQGRRPSARAAELLAGTKLHDVAERRRLFDGGLAAIEKSEDTLIRLALALDPAARSIRKQFEEKVEEPERQGYAKIAKVRFSKYGRSVAPDATFTLRLAFGTVQGYEVDGQKIPFHTTLGGMFSRAAKMNNREPFHLPARWLERKDKIDLATPLDFVSTADTIGGNSGSPVLNRAGEIIGVNFDRNRPGLVRNFVYTDVQARHIAVHGAAVAEALTKVYDADQLARELMTTR